MFDKIKKNRIFSLGIPNAITIFFTQFFLPIIMINKVTLIGRLGKDAEMRTLDGGTIITRFSLATSESYKDKADQWVEQTEWHQIVAWRDLAKRTGEQLKKGMLLYLEGKLTYRIWKDNEGKEVKLTEIVLNSYRLLSKPEYSNNSEQHHQNLVAEPETTAGDLPF